MPFLPPLPVSRIPGVGRVTEARLKQIGIQTVGDLRAFELTTLECGSDAMASASTSSLAASTTVR